jgi:hypothetical protein
VSRSKSAADSIWEAKSERRKTLAKLPLKLKIRRLIELQNMDWKLKPRGKKPHFKPWLSA